MQLTYLAFLAVFLVVPLVSLGVATALQTNRHRPPRSVRVGGMAVIVVLALAYTTPWDNYLIAEGVWWYGDGRVAARLWLAPAEEYIFIVLQSVLVAAWTFYLAGPVDGSVSHTWADRIGGGLAGFGVTALGAVLVVGPQSTFYLGAIVLWAGPVLALQWAVGWRYLLSVPRRVAAGVAVPVVYLCAIDWFAIRQGVWTISADHTTGLAVASLPIEEATFFLLTSTFVVQGLVLLRWVIAKWG
ncbi:MAG: lycopene cyclase domain-containing protein [Haloarculaceae archaeon]